MADLVSPPNPVVAFIKTPSLGLSSVALRFLTNITRALNGSTTASGVAYINLGNGATIYKGSGSPNGVVGGNLGDLYVNQDGGAAQTLWVKESGAPGSNSGWASK